MQQIATASGNLSPRTEVTRAATAAVSRPERSPTMAWAGRTDEGMKFILTGLGVSHVLLYRSWDTAEKTGLYSSRAEIPSGTR